MFIQIRHAFFHPKRHVVFHKCLRQCTCLHICAKQNRNLRRRDTSFFRLLNLTDHILAFFNRMSDLLNVDGLSLLVRCDNLLWITVYIVPDHPCPIYNRFCRAIIHIQQNLLCIRVIFLKPKHDIRSCAAESIN